MFAIILFLVALAAIGVGVFLAITGDGDGGERNDDKYTLGDRVLVEVIRASKEERAVDFKIIKRL